MDDAPAYKSTGPGKINAGALTNVASFGNISIDLVFRKLCIEDKQYALSPKELMLLYTLLRKKGELVRRAELCAAIGASAEDSALENHVHRLRKKLGKHGDLLVSKRKYGYRLTTI